MFALGCNYGRIDKAIAAHNGVGGVNGSCDYGNLTPAATIRPQRRDVAIGLHSRPAEKSPRKIN